MKILEYIKNTTPATAYTNNSESGRKMIFEELKK